MLAGAGQIGPYAAAALCRGAERWRPRVVEPACSLRLGAERPSAGCCPPPEPAPFSCALADRNARDRVEFTFSEHPSRLPGPAPAPNLLALTYSEHLARVPDSSGERGACDRPGERRDEGVIHGGGEGRALTEPALRGPRLGEILPVAAPAPEAPRRPRLDVTA